MCGIAGYIKTGPGDFFTDPKTLENMHTEIAHRGPNDYGIWCSAEYKATLLFRRLSIIDLSSVANQPMFDADRTVVICFNGEIYNFPALRRELEILGHQFSTQSDTEVFLYAFKEWGINCLDRVEGMFAVVLGNLKKNEWYLVRDRIGIKPLYFSLEGGYVSFASEIKALWHLPWLTKQRNDLALYHYLTYMVTPAPWTLYKGIYKLPASFYMKIDSKKQVTFHEWYSFVKSNQYTKEELSDENFCIERIRYLLRRSIKKHMISDVPCGVFLSGGVDSSLNVALMSEISSNVKTFNISFADWPEGDETMWARKVAHYFGTEHHEIVISEKDAISFFKKMIYHQDEPIADAVCIPSYYVSKLLKEHGVTVVQVGEGSDELFCGYQNYANYLNIYNRYCVPTSFIPYKMRRAWKRVDARIFKEKYNHKMIVEQWASGRNIFWGGALVFHESLKRNFFKQIHIQEHDSVVEKIYPGLKQAYDSYSIVSYHTERLKQLHPEADFLQTMIYLEFKQRLSELLLMRVDKMTMANSVEGRVPFLDSAFVEFAYQISTSLKYKNGQTKYILKKASEGILPHDVIYRPKVGFGVPISQWFGRGGFRNFFVQTYLDNLCYDSPLNKSMVQKFLRDFEEGCDNSLYLWVLQNALATGVV